MKQIKSFGLLIVTGILWWGLIYPELCFMEGTYETAVEMSAEVFSDLEETEQTDAKTEEEAFRELLEAGPERIKIKSKMIRKLSQ